MIYEVYRRPSEPLPKWIMNSGAVVVCLIGVIVVAIHAAAVSTPSKGE